MQELELILIDDGSTDESLKKCLAWKSDPRVRVLSTENLGVSHARNLGLEQASGEWIMFLDSDDYLLPDALEHMLSVTKPDTQEVLAAYTVDNAAQPELCLRSVRADAVHTMTLDPINHQLLPQFYDVKPMSLSSSCAKLYRSEVIRSHGIRFRKELHLSEDTLFNLDYLSCIEHVLVSNLHVVHIRTNAASVTRSFHKDHLANRIRFFDILKERNYPDAPLHILLLLFFEIGKIERCAEPGDRARLEQDVIRYLSANPELLRPNRSRSLSPGKWQRLVYQTAAFCFRNKLGRTGFALLRFYASTAHFKNNRFTAKD